MAENKLIDNIKMIKNQYGQKFFHALDGLLHKHPDKSSQVRINLAAFGKHPAWNDHIDSIGIDNEFLADVETLLYKTGISENVETERWKVSTIKFDHTFLWARNNETLLGRMWQSRDGVGRDQYPLVACMEFDGPVSEPMLYSSLSFLRVIEEQCKQADTAERVYKTILQYEEVINDALNKDSAAVPSTQDNTLHELFNTSQSEQCPKDAFYRICYHLHRNTPLFNGSTGPKSVSSFVRVPCHNNLNMRYIQLWQSFLRQSISRDLSVLVIAPEKSSWLDIIIGPPKSSQLACIKISADAEQGIPFTSSIPYEIEPSFAVMLDGLLNH